MNLIPESNGFKKVSMKKEISPFQWGKRIVSVIACILITGFLLQSLYNFIGGEKISQRLNYIKINDNRVEYKSDGSGPYTVVFDGAIGTNLYCWSEVSKEVENELDVRTFTYNRDGYGFNSIREKKTVEEQAEELHTLLKKVGLTSDLILVGEEYGSLVLTELANKYPEMVAGVVLIRPLDEGQIKTKEFKSSIRGKYYRSKIESATAGFGFNLLLDKLSLTLEVQDFRENLPSGADDEFAVHRLQEGYRTAMHNEIANLYNYSGTSQKEGMFSKVPLYIITNNEEEKLRNLGGIEDLSSVYYTESQEGVISSTDVDAVYTGISHVIKVAKKIDKLTNN